MNTIRFVVETQAKVLSTWRDDDGYGNVDGDYLNMDLQIPTWGANRTLLARVECDDDDEMRPDSTYAIEGTLFYEFPGKSWTRTYLHVDDFSAVTTTTTTSPTVAVEAKAPAFGVVAMIDALTDAHATVAWDTYDPYEHAMFTSMAKLQLKQPKQPQEPRLEVGKICRLAGRLEGPGRDQLVLEDCTVFDAVRVPR